MLKRQLMVYFQTNGEGGGRFQEYESGESSLQTLKRAIYGRSDFLDIYMGDLNGMDTARKLRDLGVKAPIVFLTASPDFALEVMR